MKKLKIVAGGTVIMFVLLWVGCRVASNQRLMNKLNPVWEIQGHVVSEGGAAIPDVDLQVSYMIGYYPIGRILEQSAALEQEIVRPDTNGFFRIHRQCSDVLIRVEDTRYKITDPLSGSDEIRFSKFLPSSRTTSEKDLKVILKIVPARNSSPNQSLQRTSSGTIACKSVCSPSRLPLNFIRWTVGASVAPRGGIAYIRSS